MPDPDRPLVEVRGLTKHFPVRRGLFGRVVGQVHAVDEASFTVPRRGTVALVGESGCGKTTTGRTLLRLLSATSGTVLFDGVDLFEEKPKRLRALRKRMQMIFQDPYASLNPRMSVDDTIEEGLRIHTRLSPPERRARVDELLDLVELGAAARGRYPHEFSGGQRQRIGIARALATDPDFLVCDEPVSALDVSIQAQILNLLMDLQARLGIALLFIAHDLAVVRHLADRVVVMYLGHVMEDTPAQALFEEPLHPYTQALLAAVPEPRPGRRHRAPVKGEIPSPVHPPPGCRFHTRCPHVMDRCRRDPIPVYEPRPGRKVKCVLYREGSPDH